MSGRVEGGEWRVRNVGFRVVCFGCRSGVGWGGKGLAGDGVTTWNL